MAAYTGITLEFATTAKVAALPAFVKWLIEEGGLHDYTDVAISGTSEDSFEEKIIKLMESENVDGIKRPGNKVALKKFWIACRDQFDADRKPRSDDNFQMDDPIPKVAEKIIVGLWADRHKFELPDS